MPEWRPLRVWPDLLLPRRLALAGAYPSPVRKIGSAGEPGQVGANLGQDHLGRAPTDSGIVSAVQPDGRKGAAADYLERILMFARRHLESLRRHIVHHSG